MIRYLIISFTLILLSSCGTSQVENISSLAVEFDGGKEDFYNKYNLWNEIRDTVLVKQITEAIDTSQSLLLCPSLRPVMWEIDVFATGDKEESDYLFTVGSNTYNKLSLHKRTRCYDNDSLIQLMIDIMKVDEIKNFKGEMSQSDYDLILQKEK